MRVRLLLIVLLLPSIAVSGCATIIHGKYQTIPISSTPQGAQVRASSGQSCTTPCELTLLRNNEYILVAELDGYKPQQQDLGKDTSGWFWANIIAGGIIGGVIDKASGSGDKLVPAKLHFDFETGRILGAKDTKSELVEIVKAPPESEDSVVTEGDGEGELSDEAEATKCVNCDHVIGNLEKTYVFTDKTVCAECYTKLKAQAKLEN